MTVMLHKKIEPETTRVKEKPNHPYSEELEEDRKQKKPLLKGSIWLAVRIGRTISVAP